MCFTATSNKTTATANVRRWRLVGFFIDKLARICQSIAASLLQSSGAIFSTCLHTGPTLSLLAPRTAAEVLKLLTSRPLKSSPVDVLPSVLLRSCATTFPPVVSHMSNLSFAECCFPAAFKTAHVLPLLKKPGVDKEQMSNLTSISKVIEQLVLDRLQPHLLSSPNFSRLQSVYRRGRSTETALLHVMNTVYADADAKITALVGLDISVALRHH